MKKTLLFIILSAIAFAVPALAGDGGSSGGSGGSDGGKSCGSCVIAVLTPTTMGELRPRLEAAGNVEVYFGGDMVSVRATSDNPVSFRVVNLYNGQTEEHPSNIFSIYTLPAEFAPEFMVIDAAGDVTLYGMDVTFK